MFSSIFLRASSIFRRVSLCVPSFLKLMSSERSMTDQSPSSRAVSTSCLFSPFMYLAISACASFTMFSLCSIRSLLRAIRLALKAFGAFLSAAFFLTAFFLTAFFLTAFFLTAFFLTAFF